MPVDREAMVAALQKIVLENNAQGKPLEVGLGRAVGFIVGSLASLFDAQERRIEQLEKCLDDQEAKSALRAHQLPRGNVRNGAGAHISAKVERPCDETDQW